MQQAWIDEQVPQCGFCQNGMMIKATELLEQTPSPTVAQINDAFMRRARRRTCAAAARYVAIMAAVQRAAAAMAKGR